ncbi:MAG: Glu-tRNA(Gln) amidotransferase subunit GatE [Candidatus Woesearchaeota archaeon]|jgi:glutamyl-tRNA(Gln) amidotransferase subunit E|nr:Glu-tRNA(Gln) amidotransferase subunit GatE [Candidatus Woesearchaeota archaeon]MDP7198751.1 Glu-tRNA(Gln) amidotransferase subunit GatE [Candidatus Woesearchaeota archaeon]MDP7467249.1 Glu-tRNA(Gln) amidotransferase subunit GatE [Candidatus Woesearchaeota archaeon]MDP7647416.1 Glu-tRNA(Gln) amidotransferase subunit GatE [Candidatus Woesearchaeota archaeon]
MKCGIEIHQELEGKKLFCQCPTQLNDDPPESTFVRKLRAVKGETEEVDVAAAHEQKKDKEFVYEFLEDNACLVEMDEAPPRQLNQEALETSITISRLLNCTIVDAAQVMRKTVVDGSNTSGFQRTSLIGRNGWIEVDGKKIGIQTVVLEEDAARIIDTKDKTTHYRLDRLGIPLLEIATDPDITSPKQCKAVAEAIGSLLRSVKVKRGIGTIRQDINVSIPGGARVEIKGAQDLSKVTDLCNNEISRQQGLIEIQKQLHGSFAFNMQEIQAFASTQSQVLKDKNIFGIKVEGAKGILGKELQPKKRFGTELSDHAKMYGAGIMHSDELPKAGITEEEVEAVRQELQCKEDDAFVITAADETTAETALKAVVERLREATKGVPKEVRKANQDGTTSYLRPMPGAARMYPETDVPINNIPENYLKQTLPETVQQKTFRYQKMGLGEDLAKDIAKENATLFEACLDYGLKEAYVAEILVSAAPTIRRQHNVEINPSDEDYHDLFKAIGKGEAAKENALDILKENKPVKDVLKKYKSMPDDALKQHLERIVASNKGAPMGALMGLAMKELRGKASGEKIAKLLKELV